MDSIFSDFTKCYAVSKTLKFSLIPQGSTLENIKKYGILDDDEEKANKYKLTKPILDRFHKEFIEETLDTFEVDWKELYDAIIFYRSSKTYDSEKALETIQGKYKGTIGKYLTGNPKYKTLDPASIIKKACNDDNSLELTDEERDLLVSFNRFSTYFKGYKKARENVYKSDITNAVPYRIVNENFSKFVSDCEIFRSLPNELVKYCDDKMRTLLKEYTLEEVFDYTFFNNLMSQKGIDYFNNILGGLNEENNIKIQGLNEYCNIAFQHKSINHKIRFIPLYKQILTERTSISFSFDVFDNDIDVKLAIREYLKMLLSENSIGERDTASVKRCYHDESINSQYVYINRKQVPELSRILFDNSWSRITELLREKAEVKFGTKTKQAISKIEKYIEKKNNYSLAEIQEACNRIDVLDVLCNKIVDAIEEVEVNYDKIREKLNTEERIATYDGIKKLLDSIQLVERYLKILAASDEEEKDMAFYSVFDVVYSRYRDNIPLYNKVRNYGTKKPYSTEKYKLNFQSPTLADGWDRNKEYTNNVMLFFDDGKYYLGILNAKLKPKFNETDINNESSIAKMMYKCIPNGAKYFSSKQIFPQNPPDNIREYLSKGFDKKTMSNSQLAELIAYVINDFIPNYKMLRDEDGKLYYDFKFKKPEEYGSWNEFCSEIDKQAYNISFKYIEKYELDMAIKNGQIFMFQVYNKDFSEKTTGKKNLHTMYWEQIFAPENLENVCIKLDGEAEMFYRKASINNPFVHKKGSVLINKREKTGDIVSNDEYENAEKDANRGMTIEELSSHYPNLSFRAAPHDIIKDKRYSTDSFAFHVPITLNHGVGNKHPKYNADVLDVIKDNPNVNIIGIDRGERHLLYVSLIDIKGNVLDQKSLNIVNKTDYHQKLDEVERDRTKARKNWKEIDNIKDLKEGYLSQAIHIITDMMIENNAIVVLEDLNMGFKNSRVHIEKQVYQKFEKMLIDKLNYLASKDKGPCEMGGISNAYQLTSKFESFKKLGKQSGFLFYVPAYHTSKIDPLTGFVNLFTTKQYRYESMDKAKKFFCGFQSIKYNDNEDYFEYEFKYSDFDLFKTDFTDHWIVCTYGKDRVSFSRDDQGNPCYINVDVTNELKKLFNEFDINYRSEDLKNLIVDMDSVDFFKKLLWLFKLTVQLRYEDESNDYILSPVISEGRFFDSRCAKINEPDNGDANGAYHIALKGLQQLMRIEDGKIVSDKKGEQAYNWYKFVQEKAYKD